MESILNCRPEDLEDFYGLLGCDELSSTEQILNEYKIRALACHPDKHPNNPRAVVDFQNLQEAKEVLCNETKRKNYDLWTRSGVNISFHDWQTLNESVKTSMHWTVRNKKEPMLEASNAGIPVTSQAENLHSDQEAQRIPLYDAMPSANIKHAELVLLPFTVITAIGVSVGLLTPHLLCCRSLEIMKYKHINRLI
ncbi:dnaJ homolog subfamily C member 12 isoform X2 [Clinocottus analis]|uniref:dnaJ homolog subfamily C member 12 isoform X2 n=1 Tax=Clinocottus analis TaxID=304258 RepID=UPI0035C23F15